MKLFLSILIGLVKTIFLTVVIIIVIPTAIIITGIYGLAAAGGYEGKTENWERFE